MTKEDENEFDRSKLKFNKQKQIFEDIKLNINHFLDNFNELFCDDLYPKIIEDTETLLEEKFKEKLEITIQYNNQIKEMEFLLASGIFTII